MQQSFDHIKSVKGELEFAGDKSISHRALLISALSEDKSSIKNLSESEDVNSTVNCLRGLSCEIIRNNNIVDVNGCGFRGFKKPEEKLFVGNSGTTARLLCGILAAQNIESVITGDESLTKRPMKRIIEPLRSMGAKIECYETFTLPLKINPAEEIKAINYYLPVASAQVKSAIIFCALHSKEVTIVNETFSTRDHTERMLGLNISIDSNLKTIKVSRSNYPEANNYFIPGDISSAAYFVVLTLLTKNSELILKNVSLNPTRLGFIEVLKKMGANIHLELMGDSNNEPYGDIEIKSSELINVEMDEKIIPNIIDEIPILAVAGIFAKGDFILHGSSELRVKESDRIQTLCKNFKQTGIDVDEYPDGFKIAGNFKENKSMFESFGDHRIAMAFGILSSLLKKGGKVNNFKCAAVSNPAFLEQLEKIKN